MTAPAGPGHLVTLVRRKRGSTCVLLPGAGGGLYPYLRLASFLGQFHDVYGVRPAGLVAGEVPHDDIAAAADSVVEVLDAATIEPAVVFGWSLGGVLGWEVCVRLADRGHHPALIVVDSSPLPRPSTPDGDDRIREQILRTLGPRPDQGTADRVLRTFEAQVTALTSYRTQSRYGGRVLLTTCPAGPRRCSGGVRSRRTWSPGGSTPTTSASSSRRTCRS
jgi:surfactin synthase thioesterase subunit